MCVCVRQSFTLAFKHSSTWFYNCGLHNKACSYNLHLILYILMHIQFLSYIWNHITVNITCVNILVSLLSSTCVTSIFVLNPISERLSVNFQQTINIEKKVSINRSVNFLTCDHFNYISPIKNSFPLISTTASPNLSLYDQWILVAYTNHTGSSVRFVSERWPLINEAANRISKIGPR